MGGDFAELSTDVRAQEERREETERELRGEKE